MKLDLTRLGAWSGLPFFADAPDGSGLAAVEAALAAESREILPAQGAILAALESLAPDAVRVVLLGQDPYPTPGHAHGHAFSVEPDVQPLPRSLANIFRELQDDLGTVPASGDLRGWADQGVLLLNRALTVPSGAAGGHLKIGWDRLTRDVLDRLDDRPRAFLLWGRPAQALASGLKHPGHLRIETAHPSPLSARRGFFGSRPFSRVNAWLSDRGDSPIDWRGGR